MSIISWDFVLICTGLDLQGNTFWEFKDTLSSHQHRMRRIAQYPPSVHYSEVFISPQWHQWLRHAREDAPTLTEQSMDLTRQAQLKTLAAEADARWAAKPSFLDKPKETTQALPATQVKDPGAYAPQTESSEKEGVRSAVVGLDSKVAGKDQTMGDLLDDHEGRTRSGAIAQASSGSTQEVGRQMQQSDPVKHKKVKEDPWKKTRGGPSEGWQPEAWQPGSISPKR